MSLRVRILLFLAIASLLGARPVFAQGSLAWPEWQWTNLGDPAPPGIPISPDQFTAEFFYDGIHGVAATAGTRGARVFYIDSRRRWAYSNVPSGLVAVTAIHDIQGKLYAATNADVIVSLDSGKSWQFSGLGIIKANDVFADANGRIRGLFDPMKVFGRVDTLHCVAQGGGAIWVSSDGGANWSQSITLQDVSSTGVVGDRCHGIFLCPNSWGTAWRSTDFGQTWKTVVTGSGPGTEYIAGASGTSYILSEPGMVRSIDDGLTWRSVITVNLGWGQTAYGGFGTHWPLFVFGPMGEHVAMPWSFQQRIRKDSKDTIIGYTQLWMTNNGGLDDLHSGPDLTDSNGMPLAQNDTMNVPLRLTSRCNAMSIGLPFYSQVDGMYETVSILKDSLGDFAFTGPTTKLLRRGHEDTLYIAYNPHHLVSTAVIKIDNKWNCSEWSETRTVMVTSLPSADLLPPPPLAGNCKIAREAAYLKLDSCSAMIIDSVHIPTRLSARLKFEHTVPYTVSKGAGDSLYFTWDPRDTLTTIFDSVKIFAHYEGVDSALWWWDWRFYTGNDTAYPPLSQFNRTIPITLYALPNVALITSDSAIAFRALKPCERVQDTLITVRNAGCTNDTVLTVNLRGAGFSMDSVKTPIIVPPDSSVTFHVTFTAPTDSVDKHGAIDLWVISGESKTVTIPLSGNGLTGNALFKMSTDTLDADTLSFCRSRISLFDTLRNKGCDTIFFGSAITGRDTAFAASVLPAFLAPSDSAIVQVEFSTHVKGLHQDTLHFQYSLGHGAMRDTSLVTQGFVRNGESFLATSLEGIDFPELYACQAMDTTIYIINQGCDTLYVDSVRFGDASFMSPTQMPLIVHPHDSLPLVIRVSPDTTNHRYTIIADLDLFSQATILPIQYIPLSLRVAYPEEITLTLVGGPAKGHSGDGVSYMLVESPGLKTQRTVHFALTNSDDLLDSTSFTGTLKCDSMSRATNGEITRYFSLTVPGASDTIATFNYTVKLADSGTTNVRLSKLTADAVNGLPGACVTSVSGSALPFTYDPQCGEDILIRYLAAGSLTIESIRPNPAKNEIELHVLVPDSLKQSMHVSAFDLLGREVELKQNSNALNYDVSLLPEGVYYIEARVGAMKAVKQLIIRR